MKVDPVNGEPIYDAESANSIYSTTQGPGQELPLPPLYHHMVQEHLLTCQARLRQESVCCTWVVWASRVAACHMAESPTKMPLSRMSGVNQLTWRQSPTSRLVECTCCGSRGAYAWLTGSEAIKVGVDIQTLDLLQQSPRSSCSILPTKSCRITASTTVDLAFRRLLR